MHKSLDSQLIPAEFASSVLQMHTNIDEIWIFCTFPPLNMYKLHHGNSNLFFYCVISDVTINAKLYSWVTGKKTSRTHTHPSSYSDTAEVTWLCCKVTHTKNTTQRKSSSNVHLFSSGSHPIAHDSLIYSQYSSPGKEIFVPHLCSGTLLMLSTQKQAEESNPGRLD